jgi:hypothetical protein
MAMVSGSDSSESKWETVVEPVIIAAHVLRAVVQLDCVPVADENE